VMCIAPLTGAGLNPARAFGPALFGGFGAAGDWLLAFVVGPVLGAVLAAQLYTVLVIARLPQTVAGEPAHDGHAAAVQAPAPAGASTWRGPDRRFHGAPTSTPLNP
jgi:hypothetical protein